MRPGAELLWAFEFVLWQEDAYFPHVSGLHLDYDSSAPPFAKILNHSVYVGKNKLDAEQLYSVTVTEGTFSPLTQLIPNMQDVVHLSTSAFEALESDASQAGNLGPSDPNRIRDVAGKGH